MQNNVTTNKNASESADTSESGAYCTNSHAPWRVAPSGNAVCTVKGTIIARGLNHEINDPEQVAANARLIAAAPELYESLLEIVNMADDPDQNDLNDFIIDGMWACARMALAKVRGEAVDE